MTMPFGTGPMKALSPSPVPDGHATGSPHSAPHSNGPAFMTQAKRSEKKRKQSSAAEGARTVEKLRLPSGD